MSTNFLLDQAGPNRQPTVISAMHSLMLAALVVLALETFVVCGLGANLSDCTSSFVCCHGAALLSFFLAPCCCRSRSPSNAILRVRPCHGTALSSFVSSCCCRRRSKSNAIRRVRPILYFGFPGQVRPGWCSGTIGSSQPGCVFAFTWSGITSCHGCGL